MPAPKASAWVTLAEAKRYLKITSSDDDGTLVDLIDWVTDVVENVWCQRTFKQATYTDQKLNGTGEVSILLPNYPVISIASLVKEKNGSVLVEGTDFEIEDPDIGLVTLIDGGVFPESVLEVKVTYDAGYATVPDDLKKSVMQAVAHEYKVFSNSSLGVLSQGIGTETATEYIRDAWPRKVTTVWDRYKREVDF